jgi:hypothetical protein
LGVEKQSKNRNPRAFKSGVFFVDTVDGADTVDGVDTVGGVDSVTSVTIRGS